MVMVVLECTLFLHYRLAQGMLNNAEDMEGLGEKMADNIRNECKKCKQCKSSDKALGNIKSSLTIMSSLSIIMVGLGGSGL
eukprot:6081852-Ditylum_brightwellii.AAC.1